jgi:hypothetical protein
MLVAYKHIAIDNPAGPPTDDELAGIEALIGRKLPQSYLDFLAVANGGYIDYIIEIDQEGIVEAMSFCSVYSTHPKNGTFGEGSVIGEIQRERTIRVIPATVLPFAGDGDNCVYLDLTVPGTERVVAFIEGLPEWTGLATESRFIHIADSFDGYLDRLTIDQEQIRTLLEEATRTGNDQQLAAIIEYLAIGLPNWREIFSIDQ